MLFRKEEKEMYCKDVINMIEQFYPVSYAMDWDNVGLLAGRADQEVKKVYVTLDLTDESIDDAIAQNADMIVTHHPLIFSPLHSVTDQDFIGRRILKLISHSISYYAMHTNYDVVRMADLASEIMELHDVEVLEMCFPEENKGIGKIGKIDTPISLKECCGSVKQKFGLDHVKVFGKLETKVNKIAILPGSGKSAIDTAVEKNADVLITGDIGHHEGIDAVAKGLAIIDAGHYGIEHIFIEDMGNFLQTHLPQIKVVKDQIRHPFQIC